MDFPAFLFAWVSNAIEVVQKKKLFSLIHAIPLTMMSNTVMECVMGTLILAYTSKSDSSEG